MNGSQQICFTDSAGKALFSIPDNGLLCLFYGNGDRHFAVCHRLDDTHAEIDGVNYSLPDFAKRMKHNQISFAPAYERWRLYWCTGTLRLQERP